MNEFTRERFSRNLYYLRTLYGMNKEEASFVLGMSKCAYLFWESGRNGCRQKNMNKLMDLFRVDEYDLYVKDLGMYYEKIPEVAALIQNRLKPYRERVKENIERRQKKSGDFLRAYWYEKTGNVEKKPVSKSLEKADMVDLLIEYQKLGAEGRKRIKELIKLYQKAA